MTRCVTIVAIAWMLVGCRAPAPSFDVLAPYGSPTVPPPRTGAVGTAGQYYAPTTPAGQPLRPVGPRRRRPGPPPCSHRPTCQRACRSPTAAPSGRDLGYLRPTRRRDGQRGTYVLRAWFSAHARRVGEHRD